MTTKIATPEHPAITAFKGKANHLKSLLKGREPAVSLGESLDILSKVEGRKKGWNEMSAYSDESCQTFQRKVASRSNVNLPGIGAQRRWFFSLTPSC